VTTLSIVMPFFKRSADFERVLPLNAAFFANPEYEVVLVMDEPSEEARALALLDRFAQIRWRVLVNDEPHAWRPPCRALNVGIRNARGEYVLVMSPESAFATDLPKLALDKVSRGKTAATGVVVFATYGDLASMNGSTAKTFLKRKAEAPEALYNFGSICAARADLLAIRGYDESLTLWGGDDVNLRLRLKLQGVAIERVDAMAIVHLSEKPRTMRNPEHEMVRQTPEAWKAIYAPTVAVTNDDQWGTDFGRVALDWSQPRGG